MGRNTLMHKHGLRTPTLRRTKLALRREIVAHLTAAQLRAVAGGEIRRTLEADCELSQLGVCAPNSSQCGDA
jgi:hypothetical protein